MANLRRSLVITFFSSSGTMLIQFIVSVILARMLSPAEIGVYSISVVFISVAHIFRDFGVATYVQREPDLTVEKMRSAIGVMFVTSWSISAVVFLLSSKVALWFKEPAMVPVMQVLAMGFIVIPFGSITHSLLTRELAAGKQSIVNAVSTVAYAASCLTLAAFGHGTMSIAYANLIGLVVTASAYIPFRPKGMPWMPSFKHWRDIVHFGGGTVVSNCLAEVNASIPDLALGKMGSATLVGLFSRANSTVSIFRYVAGGVINYGAVSYMSQSFHRGNSLGPLISRATSLVTGVGWPAFALTALLGTDIVTALYGVKWLDCVPAIMPLTIAAGISMAFQYTPTALTAVGRPYLGAVSTGVALCTRIVCAAWLFDGTLLSFAWAICLATAITTPVLAWQQVKYLDFGIREFLASLTRSAGVTAICVLSCAVMMLFLPSNYNPILRLSILLLPLVICWYVALRLTRHELTGEVHQLASSFFARVGRAT